jgi:hypothetical protein
LLVFIFYISVGVLIAHFVADRGLLFLSAPFYYAQSSAQFSEIGPASKAVT